MPMVHVFVRIFLFQVLAEVFGNDKGMVVDKKGKVGIDPFVDHPNDVIESRDAVVKSNGFG